MHTNKPEEAKGVFGVQVDDPQSANIMEWSFDENDWDASPQLVTAVAGKNAPNKEDMDFLLKAIDAALGQCVNQ